MGEMADVFHLTTVTAWRRICNDGKIRPRSSLQLQEDNADSDLIAARHRVLLPTGAPLDEAVPFYLHPVQPMFVRLVAQGRLTLGDLAIIEVVPDGDHLISDEAFVYSTNPAYDDAQFLGGWTAASSRLVEDIISPWYLVSEVGARHRAMLHRQAELLVPCEVPISAVRSVHRLEDTDRSREASTVFSEYVQAIDAVQQWWRQRERP